jgi:hypothetical protein
MTAFAERASEKSPSYEAFQALKLIARYDSPRCINLRIS